VKVRFSLLQLAQNIRISLTFYIKFIKFHSNHMKKLISGLLGLCLASAAQAGMFGSFAAKNPGFEARKQQNMLSPQRAAAFDYTFIEAGYSGINGILHGSNLHGYQLSGSYSPMDRVFLYGSFGQAWGDHLTYEDLAIGAGAYLPITDTLHLVSSLGYGKGTLSGHHGKDTQGNGLVGHVGVRWLVSDRFEAQIGYAYQNIESQFDGAIAGALLIGVTEDLKFVARGTYNDQITTYGAGLRMEFR
jgi:hypothetical protein